jgi:hypothetical protein
MALSVTGSDEMKVVIDWENVEFDTRAETFLIKHG